MAKKAPDLKVKRDEAILAKRALQAVLEDLDALKFRAKSSETIRQLQGMRKNINTGITALRDADKMGDASKRDFE